MTNVIIAGSQHLSADDRHAIGIACMRAGVGSVAYKRTNAPGTVFSWGKFSHNLRGNSHFILIVKGTDDYSDLVLQAQARATSIRIGLVFLNSEALDQHAWLLKEKRADFAAVTSYLDHARIPCECTDSLVMEDVIENGIAPSAADIIRNFVGTIREAA